MDEEEKTNKKVYSFIKYSILIICILITSFRIYTNYQKFIEYRILVNNKIILSDEEILPQISICFNDFLSKEKLLERNESLLDEYEFYVEKGSEFYKWINENFSLKDLFDLSLDYDDFFLNCTFFKTDTKNTLDCKNYCQVTLSLTKKCFSFFKRDENSIKSNWTYNRILLYNKTWVRFFIKKQNLIYKKSMDIIFDSYSSLINSDKSNPGLLTCSTDYTQSLYVSYEKRIFNRLKEPFETKCINYNESGYIERLDCLYECKARNFLNKKELWPIDLIANKSLAILAENLNIKNNYAETDSNYSFCEKNFCPELDCVSKDFRIINKFQKLDNKIKNFMELKVFLNFAPTKILEYEPLLQNSFVQLFIGPASLWLGLSVYSLSKLIFLFLFELTKKKKKKI